MEKDILIKELEKRKEENALRTLRVSSGLIDFCSNDYLGFAHSEELAALTEEEFNRLPLLNGSTGSRLISGNSAFSEMLEQEIAAFHQAEAALIFNSGYDANLGLFSCIAKRGDTCIADELAHASIIDGMRLARADFFRFRHNNLTHLEERLRAAKGNVYVAVESVYSMDGDEAPLNDIASLCEKYHAKLVVDEAHATGIFGKKGRGLVSEAGIEEKVFARVHTFGKALGCHGAAVLGSNELRNYLINFARSFIYSTALPPHGLCAIRAAYRLLHKSETAISYLHSLIALFNEESKGINGAQLIAGRSPVRSLLVPGNERVKALAVRIQQSGYDVRPILHPAVPRGKERIRVCLHAFNTSDEVKNLAGLLAAM